MIILDKINIDSATITASTEHASYKFSDALTDSRRSRYGRTTAVSGQFIDIDLLTAQEIAYFALVDHNLTDSATIVLSANSVNDPVNPVVSYTITNPDWTKLSDVADATLTEFELIDEAGDYIGDENGNIISGYTSFSEYRYWRLSISDVSNSDTYLRLSKLFLSAGVTMPAMAKNQKLPVASTSNITETPTGQVYGDAGYFYRYGNVNFPYVTSSMKSGIDTMFRANDKYKPVLIAVWESLTDEEPPIYARITSDMDFTRVEDLAGMIYSLQFAFKEMF